MILTVGLSPAIDITYLVSKVTPGSSHKISRKISKAGGKATNVASVLSLLGSEQQLLVPLGGPNGEEFEFDLKNRAISYLKLPVTNNTRNCLTVFDQQATVFNEPATELSTSEYEEFEKLVAARASSVEVVIFSGSVPGNYPPDSFQQIVTNSKQSNNFVIVDTSGEHLIAGAKAKADLLKPNAQELEELFPGISSKQATLKLLELGAQAVFLSHGESGGHYMAEGIELDVQVPRVTGNPTGAGDAFVAGFAKATQDNLTLEQCLKLASACGAAAVAEQTAGTISPDLVESLRQQIEVVSK